MARKDASRSTQTSSKWKTSLPFILIGTLVLVICIVARTWTPVEQANAGPATPPPVAKTPRAVTPAPAQRPVAPIPVLQQPVMAIVNGEKISREDLAKETVRRYGTDVLETLVNRQLIIEACQKQKLTVTDTEVNAEIKKMAEKFSIPVEQWLEMLEKERQISAEQYRSDIIWPMLALRKLAAADMVVTEQDITNALEANYGEKRQVRLITTASRAKATKLQAEAAKNPADFGNLAKDHSEDASAPARGVIPPIRRHLGEPEIEQAAFNLKVGEVSQVIKAAQRYHILLCEKHLPAQNIPAQYLHQIKGKIRDGIAEKKLRGAADKLFKEYQELAQIKNVYNDPKLSQKMPGVAATINGQPLTMRQLYDACLARHGVEVLDGEINRRILSAELSRRNATVTEVDIQNEVASACELYGFFKKDGTPDIDAWLTKVTKDDGATIELYVRDSVWPSVALKKLVEGRVKVNQEDIDRAYEANYGERVEILAIVMSNHRRAQEIWEMARETNTPQYFAELAEQYSIEPISRSNGGQVPPVRKFGGQPTIEKEVFSLKPGELSGITALGDKFVIMRCQKRIKPEAPELAAVVDNLRKDISEKKLRIEMSKEFDRLRDASHIENILAGTRQAATKKESHARASITPTVQRRNR